MRRLSLPVRCRRRKSRRSRREGSGARLTHRYTPLPDSGGRCANGRAPAPRPRLARAASWRPQAGGGVEDPATGIRAAAQVRVREDHAELAPPCWEEARFVGNRCASSYQLVVVSPSLLAGVDGHDAVDEQVIWDADRCTVACLQNRARAVDPGDPSANLAECDLLPHAVVVSEVTARA